MAPGTLPDLRFLGKSGFFQRELATICYIIYSVKSVPAEKKGA